MPKRIRTVAAKPGQLKCAWGRSDPGEPASLVYAWGGDGAGAPDGRILASALEGNEVFQGRSLAEELEDRGYDLSTMQFSICKKIETHTETSQ